MDPNFFIKQVLVKVLSSFSWFSVHVKSVRKNQDLSGTWSRASSESSNLSTIWFPTFVATESKAANLGLSTF